MKYTFTTFQVLNPNFEIQLFRSTFGFSSSLKSYLNPWIRDPLLQFANQVGKSTPPTSVRMHFRALISSCFQNSASFKWELDSNIVHIPFIFELILPCVSNMSTVFWSLLSIVKLVDVTPLASESGCPKQTQRKLRIRKKHKSILSSQKGKSINPSFSQNPL